MSTEHPQAPYLLLQPRREDGTDSGSQRRRSTRFVAPFDVELKGTGRRYRALDVSREGLLLAAGNGPLLPLQRPVLLVLHLPDGPLALMATAVRYELSHGQRAMGMKLLAVTRERELRLLRAVVRAAERYQPHDVGDDAPPPPLPRKASEYALIRKRRRGAPSVAIGIALMENDDARDARAAGDARNAAHPWDDDDDEDGDVIIDLSEPDYVVS